MNRSKSWASDIMPTAPRLKRRFTCGMTGFHDLLAISTRSSLLISSQYSARPRVLSHKLVSNVFRHGYSAGWDYRLRGGPVPPTRWQAQPLYAGGDGLRDRS